MKLFPPKGQTVARIITDICIIVVAVLAVHFSWKLAVKSLTKKLVLSKIPYFYCDICVTIGYGHLLLLAVVDMIRKFYKLFHWKQVEQEGEAQ